MRTLSPVGMLSPAASTTRLNAIDLMKGFLIMLVIIDHTAIADHWQGSKLYIMLDHVEVPTFFIIAGYFFSFKGGFKAFVTNKINRLIVPLFFFIVLLSAIDIIFKVTPAIQTTSTKDYIYHTLYGPLNYPLWFLRALFISSIIFYGIYHKIVHCTILAQTIVMVLYTTLAVLAISVILWDGIDSRLELDFYYLNMAHALLWVPLIWIGCLMRRYDLLNRPVKYPTLIAVTLLSCMAWYTLAFDTKIFLTPHTTGDIVAFYLCVVSGSIFIGAITRFVSWMPFINYFGQYSLIVLGLHVILIYIFRAAGIDNPTLLFIATCVALIPAIELFRRYFPRYTAQQDLIILTPITKHVENGR